MRIGFDGKRYFHNATGLGNYSRDLLRIMHHYHPEHEYVLYNMKPSARGIVPPSEIEVKMPQGWWTRLRALWRFWYLGRQVVHDHIELYHGLSGEIPIGIGKPTKVVVTVHDLIFEHFPAYYSVFDRMMHRFKLRYAVRRADVVVAISEQTRRDVLQLIPDTPKRIEVIYQGCAEAFKQPFDPAMAQQLRHKFQLPEAFVLNVGTIEPRKNLLTLLKAMANTPYHLVVVGKKTAYYKTEVKPYLQAHPELKARVHFLKQVQLQELACLYQLATVFCYPSLYEGFGIPIIEALFSGTPVLTHNEGCLPEAAGPDSLLVDARNPLALQDGLQMLMEQPALREQLKHKGLMYAQRFQDAQIAQRWEALYQSL